MYGNLTPATLLKMTKLSTEVSEELEALQSIFEADYQERPPVWNYPSFAIRIRSATNPDHQAHRSSVTGEKITVTFLVQICDTLHL